MTIPFQGGAGYDDARRAVEVPAPGEVPHARTGWDGRLFALWAIYNAIAYLVLLVAGLALVVLEFDVLDEPRLSDGRTLGVLLAAAVAAAVFGVVLGSLQWRVIRERIDIERRRWILACTIPAFLAWLGVGIPTLVSAAHSGEDVHAAYLFAASQTLALGPLLGIGQALALRGHTRRWAWWMPANVLSWLVVDAAVYLGVAVFGWPDFAGGEGTTLQVLLMLLATTPLTGRALLWVLAPDSVTDRA